MLNRVGTVERCQRPCSLKVVPALGSSIKNGYPVAAKVPTKINNKHPVNYSIRWGTNRLVLLVIGVSDSLMPMPAGTCPITQLPITG